MVAARRILAGAAECMEPAVRTLGVAEVLVDTAAEVVSKPVVAAVVDMLVAVVGTLVVVVGMLAEADMWAVVVGTAEGQRTCPCGDARMPSLQLLLR
jgi:hypothetical protein